MDFKNIVKKQSAIIAVSVIGLSLILLGTSYALFFKVDKSSEKQVVKTGNLTFTSSTGTQLTADLSPVDTTTGQGTTGYTFTVTNNGTLPASYNLVIYNDPSVYTTDALKETSVPFENIYVSVDGGTPSLISELPLDSDSQSISTSVSYYEHQIKRVIKSGLTLAGKTNNVTDSRNHTVRVWIKEDAEEEGVSGARVALKVDAVGVVNES